MPCALYHMLIIMCNLAVQDLVRLCGGCMQAGDDAGKAKGADKALRKEAGRLTKLQEELERLEARYHLVSVVTDTSVNNATPPSWTALLGISITLCCITLNSASSIVHHHSRLLGENCTCENDSAQADLVWWHGRSRVEGGLYRTKHGGLDYSHDFFGKAAFLTVSGQLQAEYCATALSNVYTFAPTFRAEGQGPLSHAVRPAD